MLPRATFAVWLHWHFFLTEHINYFLTAPLVSWVRVFDHVALADLEVNTRSGWPHTHRDTHLPLCLPLPSRCWGERHEPPSGFPCPFYCCVSDSWTLARLSSIFQGLGSQACASILGFRLCWELNPVLYIFLSGVVPISCTATFDLDGLFFVKNIVLKIFFKNIVLMMTVFKFNVWHFDIWIILPFMYWEFGFFCLCCFQMINKAYNEVYCWRPAQPYC